MSRPIPTMPPDADLNRVIERPDGFWWQPRDGGREHGPFTTLIDAVQDMQSGGDDEQAVDADDVRDAESVLGVPEWVDPETGQLADDEWTRTEDH